MASTAEIKEKLARGLELIPKHMHGGVRSHVELGRPVGAFLTALLEGDWEGAWPRSDPKNWEAKKGWEQLLGLYLPLECHGTPEKVAAWRAHRGLSGLTDAG